MNTHEINKLVKAIDNLTNAIETLNKQIDLTNTIMQEDSNILKQLAEDEDNLDKDEVLSSAINGYPYIRSGNCG